MKRSCPSIACLVLTRGLPALLILGFIAAIPSAIAAQETTTPPATASASTAPPQATGLLPEPGILGKAIRQIDARKRETGEAPGSGFYIDAGGMPTGAGWISAGPGYRYRLAGERVLIDGSTAISWRAYKQAQAHVEVDRIGRGDFTLGSQVLWQDLTQVHFWGTGPGSLDENRSEYRLKTVDVVGYGRVRPRTWLTIDGGAGWLRSPQLSTPVGPFDRDYPYTGDVFPGDSVFAVNDQPDFLHGDIAATVDTRDRRGHPTSGGLYRAAWRTYSDRDTGQFSFRQFEAEALQFVPIASDTWVVALHGWTVGTDTDPGRNVPFYLVPSLGGSNTIRGFNNYRFHDRNLLLLNAESRWALFTHVDAAVFVDAGNVAARFGDLNLDTTSVGFGLRLHSVKTTLARLDVAHGREGWNILLRLNDPFRFSRLSRHTAAVPFAP